VKNWLLVCAGLVSLGAAAQSTVSDPFPLIGNQAQSVAGTAAINSAMGAGQTRRTPQQSAARERDLAQLKECLAGVRAAHPPGKQRRPGRDRCESAFDEASKAWK
jgi:hypothetical protein